MNLTLLPITHQATIPESYLDMMGHMNVMWYTHLFARATVGLFQLMGMDRDYFQEHHSGSFALAQHFSYRKEVRAGDQVTLRSRLLARSSRKFHSIHFMTHGDGQDLAATGEFLGAHVDMNTRRTSPFPPHIAKMIDDLIEQHSEVGWDPPVCGAMKV
jgi:acyl-CoA thioester hydrolase